MLRYVLKRVLWFIPTVFCIAIFIFTLMHLVPGDPAQIILGSGAAPEDYEAVRESLGLNDPFLVQLGTYLSNLFFHGEFGISYITQGAIITEIVTRLPRTMSLALVAITIATVFGCALGIIASVNQNKWQDRVSMFCALIGVSIPSFWLALLLVLLFSVKLGWLPSSGIGSPAHYVLPAISVSVFTMSSLARQTRSSMLEVIRSDYITTARSKGLSQREIIFKHILPNAMIPIITILGSQLGTMMGGSLVIESVYGIPGMGTYMVSGINNRDYPVVQSCVVLLGIIFCFCMLLVDLVYAYVDPRIKAQYENSSGKGRRK